MDHDPALDAVGPRLRSIRQRRGATLAELSETTGISVSTLSRLESGGRRPTLELLLPLARAHQVPLDELVGAPPPGDPRVQARPVIRNGRTLIPLSQRPGGIRAYKMLAPAAPNQCGTRVSNSAASPGFMTKSWSARRRRSWPESTYIHSYPSWLFCSPVGSSAGASIL